MNNADYNPIDDVAEAKRETLRRYKEENRKMNFFGKKDSGLSKIGMKEKAITKRRAKNKLSRKARKNNRAA